MRMFVCRRLLVYMLVDCADCMCAWTSVLAWVYFIVASGLRSDWILQQTETETEMGRARKRRRFEEFRKMIDAHFCAFVVYVVSKFE